MKKRDCHPQSSSASGYKGFHRLVQTILLVLFLASYFVSRMQGAMHGCKQSQQESAINGWMETDSCIMLSIISYFFSKHKRRNKDD